MFMNTLKKHLKYLYKKSKSPSGQIEALLKADPDISFDKRSGTFTITNTELTSDQRADIRGTLMSTLRDIMPLASVRIDDVMTGYYDQCLERYLYERINRSKPNEETCWFKYAQNNKCIGWIDTSIPFDTKGEKTFLSKLREKKSSFINDNLVDLLERDPDGYIFSRSSRIYKDNDKVLSLCEDIGKNGFSNIESSFTPIILGYSTETGRYNVISGRHRIAALRYLRTQGKITGSLKIKCHLVRYAYDSLVVTRPYNGHCKQCKWGNIYDPGSGTHQDFFMREGIAVMRGRAKEKGGRQKWDIIEPVFREAVSGQKVLDIGAYRGLYCLKALEFGARQATALELSAPLANVIETIKAQYALDDLELIQGDFYDNDCYNALVTAKYDTVFLFGVIHHLLRLGIQHGILHSFDELFQRISKIANYGVIVEFAMPRESSLEQPEIRPYRDAFSQNAFEHALQKHFPKFKNLGRCKYKSGNRYGRFIYYGIKQ